nr:cyclin-T isoform X2 [Bactrocera oleae]XP_036216286.1 cyclin-T isoform X2 [Bactrocera oleae]XP_036216287.1 cyclin-T isoform X2 [Bactrocera oleae]XP_036216288.1 cyclin-T isoform X2 [Bactrocera oleae]
MSSGGTSAGPGTSDKDKDSHWYFSAEQLSNSPSRRQGIDPDAELSYRQMTAYLIQEMGQRLQVSQLCINTAIVYMHRFYAFHSFTHFHRNNIAAASLFLAAKVEEQPRKLEHVIKAANKCLGQSTSSTADAYYIEQAQELVFNENVLLQTLGFDVAIDHPHTHVVKTCHLVKACKDLAQTSYFLASNSLHLTSMCLQYKPTVVACFCIYLACKWSRWEIPQSTEGKHWFHYVDKTVTMDLLKQLTDEFIAIYEKSPSRLKSKLNSIKALAQNASNRVINKEKKGAPEEWRMGDMMKMYAHDTPGSGGSNSSNSNQPYAITSIAELSQQSSALLPPPPPQTQLSRKGDLHSSQHRSHHNSTSHHSKINFPPTDVLDHKNSHKQPPFSGVVSRPRDHSQSSQGHQQAMVPGNSSRSGLPSSSGRSLSSIPGQSLPRQTLQSHQLDVNYHKPREKGNIVGSYPHNAPSQSHAGHKVSQKQDPNRVIQKEQTAVKMSEPGKGASNSSSNSKIFPPTSSMATMPQYGSNPSQVQSKLDMGQDMSRNILHGQRSYGVNNGSGNVPILGSYQPPHARQSSNSASNNGKHDLSKPASVHLQQHGKQPTIPTESVYNTGTHEVQQTAAHAQSHPTAGYLISRPPEGSHNEEANSAQLPSVHAILQQPTNANQTKTSMFSPDWSQQQQQTQLLSSNTYVNNNMSTTVVGDAYNYKLLSNKEGEREKTDRDRMDANATAPKKDRNRSAHPGMDITSSMLMGVRPNTSQTQFHQQLQQQSLKISMPKKSDSSIIGELTGINAGIKRPNEGAYKQEEEQNKIRKLDTQLTLSSYNEPKAGDSNKLHVVNGIETNPDMVRSLLKESLCPSNALLKTEQLGALSLHPPAELLEPSVTSAPDMTVASAESSLKSTSQSSGIEPSSMEINDSGSNKAEKKKKKDKHKRKDKGKSKDREDRKKHKKDKDKHKERDRGELESSGHVKIKISKDKIEGTAECLKIKIPKERIISDVNNSTCSANNSSTDSGSGMHPAPALKIKISKDKLENYATDSSTHSSLQQAQALAQTAAGFYSSFVTPNNASTSTSHSSSGSSSSGKKKDRDRDKDREREKDKKRASNEGIKSNGSGSFHSAMMLQGGTGGSLLSHPPPTTVVTSKSQNVNKMQLLSNNMNQLFGESNDDDDDYDDNHSVNQKNYKDYHKNRVQNTDSFASTSNNSAGSVRKSTDYGQKYSQSHQMQR